MAQKQSGIDEILGRWRKEIKEKQRRIISFEETLGIKIDSIKQWIHPETVPLDGWQCREFTYTRKRERVFRGGWRGIAVGDTWGGPDTSALFRCRAAMPPQFEGREVVLKLYFGGDGLLSIDGRPYHGLDPFRDTVPLSSSARGDETYDLEAESYIFWHFGESQIKRVEASHFAVVDRAMHDAYWDFRAAYNVLVRKDLDPAVREFLRGGFEKAIWLVDQNEADPARARDNALRAREILRREVYDSDRYQIAGLLHLCGNSHLDVVFLWTHAEFVRKLARTHASTLRLMEQYPEYVFSQSQPLMYQEMKDTYPSMYEEVRRRVREGRWEVIGASWVEPDCNLIGGESFVRQFLHGIRFTEREFGVTPRTCWCPDVFGNAWTMPQILRKCGLEYFVTHKMGVWNDTNPWTKTNFWWQGPDGSRVFALMPPTHFIGTVEPDHMAQHWNNLADRDTIGESLYNYGWGDGGGGPDPEMLEYVKRYRRFPGVTPTRPGTIEGALDSIRAKAEHADVPVVNDELYLEEHRGVHTTKGRLKKLNRRCEVLYRKAEMWSCFSTHPYPRERLDAGWKDVLTNQFHDSLPGSHIPPVYLDLREAYDRALGIGRAVLGEALGDIASRVDTRGRGRPIVLFNSLPHARRTLAAIDPPEGPAHILDADGREVPSQLVEDLERGRRALVFEADVPGAGWSTWRLVPGAGAGAFAPVAATDRTLANGAISLRLDDDGAIDDLTLEATGCRVFDSVKRGNVLCLYEDVPGKYEAWDIAPTYAKRSFPLGRPEIELVEQGPVLATIEVRRSFGASKLRQRLRLARSGRRVDVATWCDWHESQRLLKARFFTPFVTRTATYDIAFGNIERSACRNTPYEEARFEVPAHWWMDLSQPDHGLSVLNDCKYGCEAFDGMVSLSLLRGPRNPDPTSDQEEHVFTYAVFPHALGWREGGTIHEAADLNDPVDALVVDAHAGEIEGSGSVLTLDAPRATLEAVKRAEDSSDVVVRVVERHGATSRVRLALAGGIASAASCDLLERHDEPVELIDGRIDAAIRPYEILTFKIAPR